MFSYGTRTLMKIEEDANETKRNETEREKYTAQRTHTWIEFHSDKYVHFSTTNHVHPLTSFTFHQ